MKIFEIWCEDKYGLVLDSIYKDLMIAKKRLVFLESMCTSGSGTVFIKEKTVENNAPVV